MWAVESSDGYEWFTEDTFETEAEARTHAGILTTFEVGYEDVPVRVRELTPEESAGKSL